MNIAEVQQILNEIRVPEGYTAVVERCFTSTSKYVVYVEGPEVQDMWSTPGETTQIASPFFTPETEEDVVKAVFDGITKIMLHELHETFTYQGYWIVDPHPNVAQFRKPHQLHPVISVSSE